MKKSNEKGFLLAEAIVVGVFVLSLFTFLFVNIIPLVGEYEAEEKYDTINSVYNANLVRSMIMGDAKVNEVLKLTTPTGQQTQYQVYNPEDLCKILEKTNYCKKLLGSSFLDVDSVYITWYRTEGIEEIGGIKKAVTDNPGDFPRAVREYIESMDGYTQPAGDTYEKYKRIIVYFKDGTLANLEIRIKEG